MIKSVTVVCSIVVASLLVAGRAAPSSSVQKPGSAFESDVAYLRQHTRIALLGDARGAQVAVAPGYQGRVMTSTTGGGTAPSFGWLGRAAIDAGSRQPHMNVFGGEDRFWLGPEGGQYALYFKPGDPFDLDHWQVPEPIDWGAWDIMSRSSSAVTFQKRMTLTNYAGTDLSLQVNRTVRLIDSKAAASHLGTTPASGVRMVAFESSNTVTNTGKVAWQPKSGLVSVWILGQFTPGPETTVAIPFAPGPESTLGPVVNDAYFGPVPADRLVVKDSVILFKGDGQYRSKIGLSPSRALSVAASYDRSKHVLTIVQYTRPDSPREYVNSMWETQREPYKGDAINSYNDGPPAPGKPPLGPFYELETSSPALRLAPGERYTHVHRTFHLVGAETELEPVARATLKVGLADLTMAR
jgi:hypothetical protein